MLVTPIHTPRLTLLPGSFALLRAELEDRAALADMLDADIPDSWPPELYDADATRFMLDWYASHPAEPGWGFYYVIENSNMPGARGLAVGAGGYKGGPDDSGAVEIGYSIVPERRRRGYAREAVEAWLANAFDDQRVNHVVAQTLPELTPSIGVLVATGFSFDGAGSDPGEPSAIRYVINRGAYLARKRLTSDTHEASGHT